MSDDIEFLYNTHQNDDDFDQTFYSRLEAIFAHDINEYHKRIGEDLEPIFMSGDEGDEQYIPCEDEASDIENDLLVEPNEMIDSDDDVDDDFTEEIQLETVSESFFYGKDGTKWHKSEPNSAISRIRQHNVMRFRSGPKEENSIPIEVFKKFFTPNIVFIIISQTNRYGKDAVKKWNEENTNKKPRIWVDITEIELDAFIGILLAAGYTHNNMQKASTLWETGCLPIFRAAMSFNRFALLARYIRFDDGRTRAFRQQTDKAAPIRDIWNIFNENLAKNYSPHENITIDEQLFAFRGKTKFTQYIPSKPAKYGIKIWWACDSKTHYPLQGKLYTGREEGAPREINQGENVLLQLANKYSNSGRTIVADNFFTTLDACKRLATIGLGFLCAEKE
ncbi:piggyBac transposable element-derived protein 4-like [Contarinia nasturtii]|uniref:piggyBac transposable element-derived protein 4-like n=1 Tax=Contarinia nasturtii TaxID=265458 RepID=UPI0012D4912A|nr:piggyBac transposable element-derived protein 4-like [Contarinia nasturtii]